MTIYYLQGLPVVCDRKSFFRFGRNPNTSPKKLPKQSVRLIIRFWPKLPNIRFRPNYSAETAEISAEIAEDPAKSAIFGRKCLFLPKNWRFCFCKFCLVRFGRIFGRKFRPKQGRNAIRSYTSYQETDNKFLIWPYNTYRGSRETDIKFQIWPYNT